MPKTYDVLQEVSQAAQRLRRLEQLRPLYQNAVRRARDSGHTMQEIADAAGVSRARIHQILSKPHGK